MKALRNMFIAILVLTLVPFSVSYNILVIFTYPGKSHYDVYKPLFQELGNRGHNITIISHVKTEGDIKNGRDVILSREPVTNMVDIDWLPVGRILKYLEPAILGNMGQQACKQDLQNDDFQNFLKEDNNFDVILVEFFNSNCFYGLIEKYKAPFIGLSSCAMMAWHPDFLGSPDNPSYISTIFMAYSTPMTFLERVENTVVHLVHKLGYKLFMEMPGTTLSKKHMGYEPADPHNVSLLLINIHHSLHGVRPLTPSIVEVGGIHVSTRTPQKLPKNIEDWTDGSTSGLIYFSLGSMIKGDTFPKDKLSLFLKVFSELPQRVLWKWENETMDGKPKNVMLTKWAPQFDILCHPNTILFISHGGLLGTTEAVHCGVPILVMPQFGDQYFNAKAIEKNEAGVELTLKEVTEEELKKALQNALSLKTRQKAKELSQRFRDRLVPPIETSLYWVEHVAKYKGGKHMRSEAIYMPLYQYLLLDVFVFLAISSFLMLFVSYKSLKLLLRMCKQSKPKVKNS